MPDGVSNAAAKILRLLPILATRGFAPLPRGRRPGRGDGGCGLWLRKSHRRGASIPQGRAMSVLVRCECGKENRVDPVLSTGELACLRCGRVLAPAEAGPPATDPYGLIVPAPPEDPDLQATGRHPAAALERADPVARPTHPREFLYWLLPLALLPLAFALGQPDD